MAIQQTLQLGFVLAIAAQLGVLATSAASELLGLNDAEEYFVARGHSARLECDVDGFWQRAALPPPGGPVTQSVEARWLLNGAPLSKEDGRWKLHKNGTLVVPKLGKRLTGGNAEGVYQCLAEHPRYGAVLTKIINLRIAYLKEFLRQPEDVQAREGQPIILPCSINSLPKAAVQWERDGVQLPQNIRYVPLPSGSLLITNAHSSDVGSYRCKVVNTILKKNKKSKVGYLSVLPNEDDSSASPGILPLDVQSNITAIAGDDVPLYCVVSGTSQHNIRWIYEGDVVVSNSSIVILHNITRQQAGTYTCHVLAPAGELKKVYHVNVLQAPVFNNTPSSGVYILARNIRLNCTALGYPPPRIQWFKNGRPFDVQSHIRAKVFDWGLLISSPTASDSGVYQCAAFNQAGAAWTGAAVRLNATSAGPSKPWDIKCLAYEAESVCLRWRAEPNVIAYTIIAHKTGLGTEPEPLRDLLVNESFKLVENLHANTQYTFLIRTYIKQASTEFANVTCNTGVRGMRNLTVRADAAGVVTLLWEPVSSDFNPCNETSNYYQVQWRTLTSDGVNSIDVAGFEAVITGLTPGKKYEFRVKSKNSSRPGDIIKYTMLHLHDQDIAKGNQLDVYYNDTADGVPVPTAPSQLEARVLTANSINISWSDGNPVGTSYSLCYIVHQHDAHKSCEMHGELFDTDPNGKSAKLLDLRPRTEYEVRIQAHFGERSSSFSHSLLITTPSDVPSEVQGLEYKVLTRTSACVKWEPPSHSNGRIAKYSVRHTANVTLPLESWTASSVLMPRSNDGCWMYDSDGIVISTVLHDLDPDVAYYVHVFAVNDAGSGSVTEPLTIRTKYPFHDSFGPQDENDNALAHQNDTYYKPWHHGVFIGLGIAIVTIFACLGVFVLGKYLKTRMMSSRRFAPNGGPYSSATTRPKQNGQPCHNAHELQQLVENNGNGHISLLPATILDTKGAAEYPNGVNNHKGYMNGHVANLRITENPQYYKKNNKCLDELTTLNGDREYEEDSNSNLQKVCPIAKSLCYMNGHGHGKSNGNGNGNALTHADVNATLNSTQSTVLEDSISSTSSPRQPTLGPNG